MMSYTIWDSPRAGGIFTNCFGYSIYFIPISLFLLIVMGRIKPILYNILFFLIGLAGIILFQKGSFVP